MADASTSIVESDDEDSQANDIVNSDGVEVPLFVKKSRHYLTKGIQWMKNFFLRIFKTWKKGCKETPKKNLVMVSKAKGLYMMKKIPKYFDLEWFFQLGFNFTNLLEAQRLSKLVHMKRAFYPELVKVFYTCVHDDLEANLFSTVNGVKIVIDVVVWKEVVGLDMGGVRKFDEMLDGYNKM
ncbi:hypothetical protein JHK87_044724 [Glycine soja]|nr:hypothetical protein JHK87_044724 [Glycine soja]